MMMLLVIMLCVFHLLLITKCNTEEIRFCSIGLGPFGIFTAKAAIDKGFTMIAAFTRYSKHTQTVGEVLQITDGSLPFLVSGMDKLEQIIDERKPDFCIDATGATLKSIYPVLIRLVAKGVHVLTLADEAVYPNTRFDQQIQQTYVSLDSFAKLNNVVIVGGGYSDSLLIPVIPSIVSAMQTVSAIKATFQQNIENRGKHMVNLFGIGLTEKEFIIKYNKTEPRFHIWLRSAVQSIMDGINHPILEFKDKNGQKTLLMSTTEQCYKCDDKEGVYSKLVDKKIAFGDCVGSNTTLIAKGANNVEIIFSVIYGVTANNDQFNDLEVQLYGTPNIEFYVKDTDPFISTALPLVHRVPMVLNQFEPGFHSVDQLNVNKFWAKKG